MQTILIMFDPSEIKNADDGLYSEIARKVEEITENEVEDNGFDYIGTDDENARPMLGIWLQTEDAEKYYPAVVKLLKKNKFRGNDLSTFAEVLISENEEDYYDNCKKVFPSGEGNSEE